jgi:hypothetical protein
MAGKQYPAAWFPQRSPDADIDEGDQGADALTAGALEGQPREYPASLLPKRPRRDDEDGFTGRVD